MGQSFVQRVSPSPTFIWTAITLESWAILSFSFLRATVEELWSSSLEKNSFVYFEDDEDNFPLLVQLTAILEKTAIRAQMVRDFRQKIFFTK